MALLDTLGVLGMLGAYPKHSQAALQPRRVLPIPKPQSFAPSLDFLFSITPLQVIPGGGFQYPSFRFVRFIVRTSGDQCATRMLIGITHTHARTHH